MSETPERLAARLERLVRADAAREARCRASAPPSSATASSIWETAVGVADVAADLEATPDTQYRIGSITKTFTAAAIMQLRDAGKLDLEDTLDRHVEGAAHTPTIRRLLSHASGLQRETQDDSWLTPALRAAVTSCSRRSTEAELVLPAGARFHYSNLAFALLGIVVERVSGLPYQDYVRERLFEPVGLTRVSFEPEPPAAKGYLAQPYADGVWDTIGVETGAWASAGQLWAHGRRHLPLGRVPRRSRRVRACLLERRGDADGAGDRRPRALAVGLRARARAAPRRRPDPRRPRRLDARLHRSRSSSRRRRRSSSRRSRTRARRTSASSGSRSSADDGRGVAGRARDVADRRAAARRRRPAARHLVHGGGAASCSAGGRASSRRASTGLRTGGRRRSSSAETDDRWRTVSGPEHGEALRIVRGEDGSVERMVWAGYPVTREPGPWRAPE